MQLYTLTRSVRQIKGVQRLILLLNEIALDIMGELVWDSATFYDVISTVFLARF